MIKNLVNYWDGRKYHLVEILDDEDAEGLQLEYVDSITDMDTMKNYVIYRDFCNFYYAILED